MKYCEIYEKYYFDVEERERQEREELIEILNSAFADDNRITIDDIRKCKGENERYLTVYYTYILDDNYTDTDTSFWQANQSLEDFVQNIKRHVNYIIELRQKYAEYAKKNDYIQRNRRFDKEIMLYDEGYPTKVNMSLKLCGYLKLPNTTECSVGGGDYEIKRTPQRFQDFIENIDRLTEFFIDCISDLRVLKSQAKALDCEVDNEHKERVSES